MAGLWGRFVSVFQKNNNPVAQDIYAPAVIPEHTSPDSDDPYLIKDSDLSLSQQEQEVPHWLIDEEALRDEGVLFGLAESDPTTKTDIIHKYYVQLIAPFERQIEEVNERIQELNLFIEQRQTRIRELNSRLMQLETLPAQPRPHQVLRTGAGLVLSILMCIGNFNLIEQSLQNNFSQSTWVALGVFLTGMFNLFGAVSVFHDNSRERPGFWRLLEETGVPLAASLFVLSNVWGDLPWWRAIALFLFVLFLFLFSGKLFLGLITVFREDLTKWMDNRKDYRKEATDKITFEQDIVKLNAEIDEIRTQKWQRIKEQGEAEESKSGLLAKRDMLIRLFESEFNLARQVRNTGRIKGVSEL